jgi:hypothetical protein
MLEFKRFANFTRESLAIDPVPKRIELTKVDHFVQGEHWTNFADLSTMLPALRGFADFAQTESPAIGVRYAETAEDMRLSVAIDSALAERPDQTVTSLVKLETRFSGAVRGDLHAAFTSANSRVNAVFSSLIPLPQRSKRFSPRGA